MKNVKKTISYILSFILMVIIVSITILNILSKTVFNKKYIISKIEENSYYEKLNKNIKLGFEEYIQQSGLDEEVLENIYSKEDVKKDLNKVIDNIYENKKEKISTDKVKEKLKNNINIYLKGTKLNKSQKEAINEFIEKISKRYENEINHISKINEISNAIANINKYTEKTNQILIISIIAIITIIILINIKNISEIIKNIFIALLGAGLILITIYMYITMSIKIKDLLIIDKAFSELIKDILTNIINQIRNYGIIYTITSIILIFFKNFITKKK